MTTTPAVSPETAPVHVLTKHHGLGNDFLVLVDLDGRIEFTAELAQRVCDRRRGVGADGLIVAGPPPRGDAESAVATMVLRNADGSRAEMSGNGIRCLAQALVSAGVAGDHRAPFAIATDAGPRVIVPIGHAPVAGTDRFRVDMGLVQIVAPPTPDLSRPEDAAPGAAAVIESLIEPGARAADIAPVWLDAGNPHVVILLATPKAVESADLVEIGQAMQGVTGGINVELVAFGPDDDEITMAVYERGVGPTQACGTGACATAVAAIEWGAPHRTMTVTMPGGPVTVDVHDDGSVALTGPATMVASVSVLIEPGEVRA